MSNINMLKQKLDKMLVFNAPYDEIYKISVQIDKLLLQQYTVSSQGKH